MRLVSVRKAARETGIGEKNIRRAVEAGELSAFRFGSRWNFVDLDALAGWIKTKRVEAGVGDQNRSLED